MAALTVSAEYSVDFRCLGSLPLQFHKLRRGRLKNGELRQLPTHHSDFIAVILPRTAMAVFVEFVRNFFPCGDRKAHAREKLRDAREKTHARHFLPGGLLEQCIDQATPRPVPLRVWNNCDRAYFSEMRPVEMQRAATHDSIFVLNHHEVADVLTDLRERSGQECAIAR